MILNLGDSADGSLDPAGAVDRLRNAGAVSISGNQDRIIWNPPDDVRASADFRYVTGELGPGRIAWLKELPGTLALGDLFACHGTPGSDETYLLEEVTEKGAALSKPAAIAARRQGRPDRARWIETGRA